MKIEKIIEGNKETNNYSIGNVVMTTEQKLRKFI